MRERDVISGHGNNNNNNNEKAIIGENPFKALEKEVRANDEGVGHACMIRVIWLVIRGDTQKQENTYV